MSRTKRGSKPPGWEIWSKRAGSAMTGWNTSAYMKKRTHKMERQEGKKETLCQDEKM